VRLNGRHGLVNQLAEWISNSWPPGLQRTGDEDQRVKPSRTHNEHFLVEKFASNLSLEKRPSTDMLLFRRDAVS
jgi:hypothetical protein